MTADTRLCCNCRIGAKATDSDRLDDVTGLYTFLTREMGDNRLAKTEDPRGTITATQPSNR